MLLPGCQCCGTTGCTCACGDYANPYLPAFGRPTIPSINQCCPPECVPCEITIELIPGNTWGGSYNASLSNADRSEIRAFLAQSFVAKPRCNAKTYEGAGQLMDTTEMEWWYTSENYVASFGLAWSGSDSGLDCFDLWANSEALYMHAIRGGLSSSLMTLSSGKVLDSFFIKYPARGYAGFSVGSWCGLSSWSHTVSIAGNESFDEITIYDPALPGMRSVSMEGHQLRFSW